MQGKFKGTPWLRRSLAGESRSMTSVAL